MSFFGLWRLVVGWVGGKRMQDRLGMVQTVGVLICHALIGGRDRRLYALAGTFDARPCGYI